MGPGLDAITPESLLLNEDCFEAARDPVFVDAKQANLAPDDAVLGLESPGRVIAIPLRLIAYHRVVDLAWGQRRVLVTYAPLDDGAAVFQVPRGDEALGFGVAGHHLRDLLLYDKRKRSLWKQKSGACVDGWRAGEQLERLERPTRTTWNAWRLRHPTVRVMAPVAGMEDRYLSAWRRTGTPPGLSRLPVKDKPQLGATWLHEDPPPSIDDPVWIDADQATHVGAHDEVLGFQSRLGPVAVPVSLLSHHHAINAYFDGEALLVAMCDLCKAGAVYEAQLDGARLTFDLAGAHQGSALLEDRQTRSRWSVVTGACVFGWYHGTQLRPRDVRWSQWGTWLAEHAKTRVLAARDVPARDDAGLPAQVAHTLLHQDDRLSRNALVLGLSARHPDKRKPKAYAFQALRAAGGVANDTWGDVSIVVLFDAGTRTAVAYRRDASQTFRRDEQGRFVDAQTGSTWTLGGRAVDGPRSGATLQAISGRAQQVMWYAWTALHQDSGVWK